MCNRKLGCRIGLLIMLVADMGTGCILIPDDSAEVERSGTTPRTPNSSVEPGGSESGRLTGITAAHNTVRARVDSTGGPLEDLVWSDQLADIAQDWAEHLAAEDCAMEHSKNGYGENLAWLGGQAATSDQVVRMWAQERDCYTYGTFMTGDNCSSACDRSGGCGHYTQVVWRNTKFVGCGMMVCEGNPNQEVWVCNYDPPGNYLGETPF